MFCDLHMHSTASDGTDAPQDLPALAAEAGLAAFALTDHDTTAGLPACAAAAEKAGLTFVPGIELSADPGSLDGGPDGLRRGTLHILGYFVDHDDPELARLESWLAKVREQRNPAMVERLSELGVQIDYGEVLEQAGGRVVGRPHIAQVLVKKGYVKSIHEAFARYIGEGAAAHVRKDRLSPAEAIAAIHHAGGLAVLAHPVQLHLPEPGQLEQLTARLKQAGLDGIEIRHHDHQPGDVARFARLAERLDLVVTGGSDYHGTRKQNRLGETGLERAEFEKLLATRAGQG